MKTEDCIRHILENIGEDPDREGLVETPKRVAKAQKDFFSGYTVDPKSILKTFTNEGYDEMLLVRGIDYFSHCEHHIVPFFGKVDIAYIPDKEITGLSKLPRLVEVFARRLQNQERMTVQIAQTLYEELKPKGVAISVTGTHLCMVARGVKQINSETITTCFLGDFEKSDGLRNDFFSQIKL